MTPMFSSSFLERSEITAVDGCRLRELLHPERVAGAPAAYSLAVAMVDPGQATHPHALGQTEVYYLICGTGRMHLGDEVRAVQAGDAIVIPAHARQWIENTGSDVLEFIALVSPPWRLEEDRRA